MCPSYDDSISKNDFYRLEKAFRYAIVSNGTIFGPRVDNKPALKDIYDLRSFFFVMDSANIKEIIEAR